MYAGLDLYISGCLLCLWATSFPMILTGRAVQGFGTAVVGSLSTFISLLLGTLIGQSYAGTILPLLAGFTIYSLVAVFVMRWVDTAVPAVAKGQ